MKMCKIYLGLIFSFLVVSFSYAGENLLSKEALREFNEGVKFQKAGDNPRAFSSYEKAALMDPLNSSWQKYLENNHGVMYAKDGDLDKAEKHFLKALEVDPDYRQAAINLGLVYDKKKTRLEALEYWMKAYEVDKLKPKDFVVEDGPRPAVEK